MPTLKANPRLPDTLRTGFGSRLVAQRIRGRSAAICATAILAGVFSVAPANATPVNPPVGATFTLVCNGQPVLITAPGYGFTPRMSVDGTTRFIPLSLTLTITDLTTNAVLSSQTLADRAFGAARVADATCVDISTQVDPASGDLIEYNYTSQDIQTPVG
jgi:hypothetical protein